MNGITAYFICLSIQLHFKGKRDLFKYGYMKNLSEETYRHHRDRFIFEAIARKWGDNESELRDVCATVFFRELWGFANVLKLPGLIPYGAVDCDSLREDFENISKEVLLEFKNNTNNKQLPQLLHMMIDNYNIGDIGEDTVCVIFDAFGKSFDDYAHLPIKGIAQLKRLAPFVVYDKPYVNKLIQRKLETK